MTLSAYVRKAERSEINKISFHSKKLEKEEQITSKWNQRKKIAQVSTEIDKTENSKRSVQIPHLGRYIEHINIWENA